MQKNEAKTLPELNSVREAVAFFETHDMGDYWEQMPEAAFEIGIKGRKHLVALEEDVAVKVARLAKEKNVPSEALVNVWLKEKLRQAG